ncbi:cache domain-containing protein [Kribbella sp. NBC_00709]|uniref:cache domain-containing protein n=1 Tax=Kribbella sp. NBC_00709 TaxID=2975972 RepID=UPI002E283447|nr:cache domain-containing protein [Kribbella sp. NBC_00709]
MSGTDSALALDAGLETVLELVESVVGEAFGLADRIGAETAAVFTRKPSVRRADLGGVLELAQPVLEDPDARIQGAGFIAAVDALADSRWWLEWFMLSNGTTERLIVDTDPRGENFYNYESLPWYDVPQRTGRRHITGPYVDYLCTDDYTLTFTVPVTVEDRFVGVAGADVRVFTFEKAILPYLRATHRKVAIVNDQGRVVLSNSARHVGGTLLRTPTPSYRIEDLPLSLVELSS